MANPLFPDSDSEGLDEYWEEAVWQDDTEDYLEKRRKKKQQFWSDDEEDSDILE